ncbi:MAG TPA: hypothetical protein DDW20_06085 [Firmicutes bacterium]|nr:hypothetical protein [Bacillota bacterium]
MSIRSRKLEKETNKKMTTPFDKEYVIKPLKMFVIIVPYGQANGIIKVLNELESAMNFITNGEGTYQRESQLSGPKKQIIFTFLRDDKVDEFKEKMAKRFTTSNVAKGIAFSIKLTSVAGVSVYKFLSNARKVEKKGKKDE